MSLFSILVDVAARTASFESGIQRVERRMGDLDRTVKRFAAGSARLLGASLSFEALRRSIGAAVERGDELDRLSHRMKTTTEFLSQMQYVASQSDVPFQSLASSVDTMRKNVALAAEGLGKARPALKALGIDAKEFAALPLDKQLDTIADRMAGIENPTVKTGLALRIFGDTGTALLPVLDQGSDGMRRLREESDRLGKTLSTNAARQLAELDAKLKQLKASAEGLQNRGTTLFAPFLAGAADAGRRLLGGATEIEVLESKIRFLKEQRATIPIVFQIGYIEGASIVMGPDAIDDALKRMETSLAALKRTAQSGGGGEALLPVTITAQRQTFVPPKHFINPQTMRELQQNFEYIEEIERKLNAETERNMALLQASLESGIQHGIADTTEQIEAKLSSMVDSTEDATTQMSTYAEQAARNMQDTFANFLFDPFEGGLNGMLKGFVDVLRRMLAEAASAQIFEALFGKGGTDSNALGGLGQIFSSFLGGAYGGTKAGGGPLQSGKWYIAGERGPEPIWGGGAGAYAMGYGGAGGGGNNVSVVTNIDARGTTKESMPLLLAAMRKNNAELKVDIIRGIQSGRYPISK